MAVDYFAELATNRNNVRKDKLSKNLPMSFTKTVCALDDLNGSPLNAPKKMTTKEELFQMLKKERESYEPFLKNYAPEIPICTKTIPIQEFLLDDSKYITIPYYGGPLGNALQKYTGEFELLDDFSNKAVYICFGGADYHASVYINDYCVGMHEGFFSPFEFEITDWVRNGKNDLKIMLKNDYIIKGNDPVRPGEKRILGDKLYAATGLGYDDPEIGWHHCPPGMGIYNYVRVEIRNRLNITDVSVRPYPEKKKAEVWIEVENADYVEKTPVFSISVFGQNFEKEVVRDYIYEPYFCYKQQKVVNKQERSDDSYSMNASHGNNIYKIMVDFEDVMLWDTKTPYLYQVQVTLSCDNELCDVKKQQFGMRSFTQDLQSTPKGMFYLNGKKIRLRGANTMGFEQQDVLRGDLDQLIDDILLAKICNMNFLRLTQRPVQDEIYEYCDKLGMMTQTDLPLFCCMRRTKYAEGMRQTEEMIKMVRKHPCNVVVSYINEPVPFGWVRPHRHMMRNELEDFFDSCDKIVKLNDPDCVIKHVDGDYDPPTRNSIADNHCYNLWYNGHEIDFGKMYRGYWTDTDAEWCCACGEYGAEGLDCKDLMNRRYPAEWLKEPFNPANIVKAQAMNQHGAFFDTPTSIDEWVEETQKHQAFAAKVMTECFRRNPNMISSAIHLFIDAWPSGWMKSIMDCERTPKQAYFTYRDALEPILITLRADRLTYYENEKISIETYISNDIDEIYTDCEVVYELYSEDKCIKCGKLKTDVKACDVTYVANAEFMIQNVQDREKFVLKAYVLNKKGEIVSSNDFAFEVFSDVELQENDNIIYIQDLNAGTHEIAGEIVTVYNLDDRHFVSRATGHAVVEQFEKNDFKYWYNESEDRITPIANRTFVAEGFTPILQSNNKNSACKSHYPEPQMVVGEKIYEGKKYVISFIDLRCENPVAKRFKKALYES